MRLCTRCGIADARIIMPLERCTCAAGFDLAPDDEHTPDCHMVGHLVRWWIAPVLLRQRDLIRDHDAPHGYRLPPTINRQWELIERIRYGANGTQEIVPGQYVRRRLLCSSCIIEEAQTMDRVREYQQVRAKLAKANDGIPWARGVAMQDML